MKLGIVGLPNVGKSTLFNALTKSGAQAANYPFCTIDPNVGTVAVPDERLGVLAKLYNTEKIVPAFVDFVDIAGLVKGASQGEGLGNKFLSHIRETDAIVHVVRCFENKDIIHVEGSVNPARDIETIDTELILADIESLGRRIEKAQKTARSSSDKKLREEVETMERLMKHLSDGKPARTFAQNDEEKEFVDTLLLLTSKPIIYAANVSEDELVSGSYEHSPFVEAVRKIAAGENAEVVVVSAEIEEEIAQLEDDEKAEYMEAMGFAVKESGLDRLIKASYKLLGLFSYLTAGQPEVRAWTIPVGTKAPQAAGKIHSDFEKGFIRAEIVSYPDLIKYGSVNAAREAGKVRIEGKDYVMQDNDIVHFRFNN
ncbi:MAG: redox-regulated ATPase YchF [Spirochaetales bacterium]|nr:redox-regulated ATPase YchF [Spirochaetales bacterium]